MITFAWHHGAQASPAVMDITIDENASASGSQASEQSVLLESLEDALSADVFDARPLAACTPDGLDDLLAAEREAEERAAAPAAAAAGRAAPVLSGAERANLVNWMTSAASQLGLGADALFTAVGCLDDLRLRPGAPRALMRGAACLWLAAKWTHGARAPPASAVVATLPACACGGCEGCGAGAGASAAAAARRQLLRAEGDVLRALDYGAAAFRRPTAETFLRAALLRLQHQAGGRRERGAAASSQQEKQQQQQQQQQQQGVASLCSLLAEQSLLECQLRGFRPSAVAAACVAYGHALAGRPLTALQLAAATGCGGAAALGAVSRAADVLRAVHAAVAAAAAGGNPYACSLRWLRLDAAALTVPPIAGAGDARVALLAAGRKGGLAGDDWAWFLPECAAA
ncbi:hypothetical protein MNEG_6582 [Monoraphidium neglectum]|uniref:Cyclin N-terminal domain-containing protein n=1 Tax=Monoraphidium neglectum TaxID=145388 RepID=A0A0D2MDU9_9CHLO|nr:hypothetical protein MNEG_6582 [Monoraphidium neglectum]KIZ01380.1 hypothetical protein MNEG_6582 [Monoraphidium neglectum]|eukprot:XP_013900399.1 hypothetical protein MNEG_6582 [Monoraphidium neglectum]